MRLIAIFGMSFRCLKLQICVSLKGNACTENEPVIKKLSCVPVGRC